MFYVPLMDEDQMDKCDRAHSKHEDPETPNRTAETNADSGVIMGQFPCEDVEKNKTQMETACTSKTHIVPAPYEERQNEQRNYSDERLGTQEDNEIISHLQNIEVEINDEMEIIYEENVLSNLTTDPEAVAHSIFNTSFNKVVSEYQNKHKLQKNVLEIFQENVNSESLRLLYIDVHKAVLAFHSELINQLNPHIESSSSPNLIQAAKENVIFLFSEESKIQKLKQILHRVSEKLSNYYMHQLQLIIDVETGIFQQNSELLYKIVKEIYVHKMGSVTAVMYLSPKKLTGLHAYLSEVFIRAAHLGLYGTDEISDRSSSPIIMKLNELLKSELEVFKEANRTKLGMLQKVVDQILTQQKKVYCDKMEEILLTPKDIPDLSAKHEDACKLVKSNLKSEIAQKIGADEPCENYIQTLDKSIVKYWDNFQFIYSSDLRKNNDEPRKIIPPEIVTEPEKNFNAEITLNEKLPLIPLIVMHLSLSQIIVAYPDDEEDKVKEFCKFTSNLVLTSDGKLNLSDRVESNARAENIFKFGDYLVGKYEENPTTMTVNNMEMRVTAELLLGFVFHKLKQKIEVEKRGQVHGAIIIVPFWLTSYQRQQIIDAGRIAGFNNMRLINENLAIAVYAASKQADVLHDIFVVSENSDKIDATVYSVCSTDGGPKVVKVIGHCGNDPAKNKGKTKERATDACLEAQSQSQNAARKLKQFMKEGKISRPQILYISNESARWKQELLMAKINIYYASMGSEECWKEGVVINGAWIYARNLYYKKTFRDKISTNILCQFSPLEDTKKAYIFFSHKKDQMPDSCLGAISKPLPDGVKEVCFVQKSKYNGREFNIGQLLITSERNDKQKLYMEMSIDKNGIAKFLGLTGESDSCSFVWTPSNLNETQINEYKSVICSVNSSSSQSTQENKLKQELIEKFNDRLTQINNGEGNFRSDIGRQMALDQVVKSISILKDSDSVSTIENQQKLYDTISKKFQN